MNSVQGETQKASLTCTSNCHNNSFDQTLVLWGRGDLWWANAWPRSWAGVALGLVKHKVTVTKFTTIQRNSSEVFPCEIPFGRWPQKYDDSSYNKRWTIHKVPALSPGPPTVGGDVWLSFNCKDWLVEQIQKQPHPSSYQFIVTSPRKIQNILRDPQKARGANQVVFLSLYKPSD